MGISVCVASSFPEGLNVNAGIAKDVVDGFREVLGEENVFQSRYFNVESDVLKLRTPTRYAAMKASSNVTSVFSVVSASMNIFLGK